MLVDIDEVAGNLVAPSPKGDGETIFVKVKPELIRQLASVRNCTKLLEFWFLVAGVMPPVANIGYHERDDEPYHWAGMKEAARVDVDDGGLIRYVMLPKYTYQFVGGMVCTVKRFPAPADALFVVWVKGDEIVFWDWVDDKSLKLTDSPMLLN